jgi:hypothetical protein
VSCGYRGHPNFLHISISIKRDLASKPMIENGCLTLEILPNSILF